MLCDLRVIAYTDKDTMIVDKPVDLVQLELDEYGKWQFEFFGDKRKVWETIFDIYHTHKDTENWENWKHTDVVIVDYAENPQGDIREVIYRYQ